MNDTPRPDNNPEQIHNGKPVNPASMRFLIPAIFLAIIPTAAGSFYVGYRISTNLTAKQIPELLPPVPTPEVTQAIQWKTYTGKQNFTIQLPPDWVIHAADKSTDKNDPAWNYLNSLADNQIAEYVFGNPSGSLVVRLNIFAASPGQTTDIWADNYFVPLATDPKNNLASYSGELTISGEKAKRFKVFDFGGSVFVSGLVYKNNLYEFSYTTVAGDPDTDTKVRLFENIISGFKFIK